MKHIFQMVLLSSVYFFLVPLSIVGQDLVNEKIIVGKDAPAFIKFNADIKDCQWDNPDVAKQFYSLKVLLDKKLKIVSLNNDNTTVKPTKLTVIEGSRQHTFLLVFKPDYEINKDPELQYDYSDLKKLKVYAEELRVKNNVRLKDLQAGQKQADETKANTAANEPVESFERLKVERDAKSQYETTARDIDKEIAQEKQMQIEKKRKNEEDLNEAKKKEQDLNQQNEQLRQKILALEQQQKRKDDSVQIVQQEKLKTEKALAAKIEAEKKAEKQRAADIEKLAEKKESARLKAEREEQERKLAALQRESQRKAKEDEARLLAIQKAKEDAERKKQEQQELKMKLQKLEQERRLNDSLALYSRVGLWSRYGSKGIDVFEMPRQQMDYVNADYFYISDTLKNYQVSKSVIAQSKSPLNISSSSNNQEDGVSMTLESVTFEDAKAYFKIHIQNRTKDDYLMGLSRVHWYDKSKKSKKWLTLCYITYIKSFPIVLPGRDQYVVLVTREPNITDDESLVILINERRAQKPVKEIYITGKRLNEIKAQTERTLE